MSDNDNGQGSGKLGFLDSLGRLFRGKETPVPAPKQGPGRFDKLEQDFEAAIQRVNREIEERRRASPTATTTFEAGPVVQTPEQRAAERAQRTQAVHRAIRDDIEKMHEQLGTGISGGDLEQLAADLREIDSVAAPGRQSQTLMPRALYAIAEKLRAEAGELAVARLVASLERAKLPWPDPTRHLESATPEEIERSRRRRLGDVREAFLGASFERTAERLLGVVKGWGGDYPDRGSPLWQECVLEAVAAGIRAKLVREFVELLRRDRDALLGQVEASIGKELAAVDALLKSGVGNIEEASKAVAGPFRVIDEMAPQIAWERVRAQLPPD